MWVALISNMTVAVAMVVYMHLRFVRPLMRQRDQALELAERAQERERWWKDRYQNTGHGYPIPNPDLDIEDYYPEVR